MAVVNDSLGLLLLDFILFITVLNVGLHHSHTFIGIGFDMLVIYTEQGLFD